MFKFKCDAANLILATRAAEHALDQPSGFSTILVYGEDHNAVTFLVRRTKASILVDQS